MSLNQIKRMLQKRGLRYVGSFNYAGIVVAAIFFCLSQLPSIMPRPWIFQAFISGVSSAVGYGLGVLVFTMAGWFMQKDYSKNPKHSWWYVIIPANVLMFVFVILGHGWQNEVRKLVGQPQTHSSNILGLALVSLLLFSGLIGLSRSIRLVARKLNEYLSRWIPKRIGILLGTSFVVLLITWIINGFMLGSFIRTANNIYAKNNDRTSEGIVQPTQSTRSGSSQSKVAWDGLGLRGRDFVARGPTQQQLETFSGQTPMEPVRVYVGVKNADTPRERARLAVQELQRTGAFDRKVLVLATATGSGWLEPQAVDSIEYMYNGNSAIVTQQYSYLPSWISFIVDSENARDAGRELYDAVYTEWSKRPVSSRPKLVSYGLSLGSFGGQAAFSSAQDVERSVDGALFVGTPNNTELWRTITDRRDAGSHEIKPVYSDARSTRFASTQQDMRTADPATAQKHSHTLFLQHASDPVVWWSYDLLIHRPDRLTEPRGEDVSAKVHWIPLVTFFQATVDQFFGVSVPNGHGHNYANVMVDAWATVAAPEGWSQAKSDQLQKIIDAYPNE